jgi:hypothetical protein
MDHFVSLEIGGADTLDNIWPQCGPPGSKGEARDFRKKDKIEQFLGRQVRGGMSQQAARQKITRDWSKAGPKQ